jgi:RND family efflux transporter MFP subunit
LIPVFKNILRSIPSLGCLVFPALAAAQYSEFENGEFECVLEPNMEIELSAPMDGVLSEVRVQRGDTVKKGQLVAELTSGAERATVDLAKARADFAGRTAERNDDLYAKAVISIHTKDESDTDLLISNLQHRQAEERFKLRMVHSPIDGVVVERDKDPGEYIENESLLTIVSLDPLHVEVVLPAERFGEIEEGVLGDVSTLAPASNNYQARVTLVDQLIDAASGTFRVRLALDNPGNRIPAGLGCRVNFN